MEMDRHVICEALQIANDKLNYYLGEETHWFNKEEITQLQSLFEDKITFAKAMWVRTENKQGQGTYWAHYNAGTGFGLLSCEQLMKQLEILNKRVERCVLLADKFDKVKTQDELYQVALDEINKYIQQTIEDTEDARMDDIKLKHRRFMDTAMSIEQGKLVKESGEKYTCIVSRYKCGDYKGSLVLDKFDDGKIRYEYRAPLGGHCRGVVSADQLLQTLKSAAYYIIM